jgi:hypothetical protein
MESADDSSVGGVAFSFPAGCISTTGPGAVVTGLNVAGQMRRSACVSPGLNCLWFLVMGFGFEAVFERASQCEAGGHCS